MGLGRDTEYCGSLVAAETFAEQFDDDKELRTQLFARVSTTPTWTPPLAALAEFVLRQPDP